MTGAEIKARKILHLIKPALKKEKGVAGLESIMGYMTNRGIKTEEALLDAIENIIKRKANARNRRAP